MTPIGQEQVAVGARISVDGHSATVRYVGGLAGKQGIFYGIEYDDTACGRHSGDFAGAQVFTTVAKGAGAFISTAKMTKIKADGGFGQPFLDALRNKYVHAAHDKTLALGGGDVDVATVGWDKISATQSNLSRLEIVGLADMAISTGNDQDIANTCPLISDLDLSRNLFSNWADVKNVCRGLEKLGILRLAHNRLQTDDSINATSAVEKSSAFPVVHTLVLANASVSANELGMILEWFPSLLELVISANMLQTLGENSVAWRNITRLNLDDNKLTSAVFVHLAPMAKLETLSLQNNPVVGIPVCASGAFLALASINLNNTLVDTWIDVDHLNTYPSLTTIRLARMPITTTVEPDDHFLLIDHRRQQHAFLIARLSKALVLNGSQITKKKRADVEMYYLGKIAQDPMFGSKDFHATHPVYEYLCGVYGTPARQVITTDTKANMLQLKLKSMTKTDNSEFSKDALKLLSRRMTTRQAKLLVARVLYPHSWRACLAAESVLVSISSSNSETCEMLDMHMAISDYGLQNGDCLGIVY